MDESYTYSLHFASPSDALESDIPDLATTLPRNGVFPTKVEDHTGPDRRHQHVVLPCPGPVLLRDWLPILREQADKYANAHPPPAGEFSGDGTQDDFIDYDTASDPFLEKRTVIYDHPGERANPDELKALFISGVVGKIEEETGCGIQLDPTGKYLSIFSNPGNEAAGMRAFRQLRNIYAPTKQKPRMSHATAIEKVPRQIKQFLRRLDEVRNGEIWKATLLPISTSIPSITGGREMHIAQYFSRVHPTAEWNLKEIKAHSLPQPLESSGLASMWARIRVPESGKIEEAEEASVLSAPVSSQHLRRTPALVAPTVTTAQPLGRIRVPKGMASQDLYTSASSSEFRAPFNTLAILQVEDFTRPESTPSVTPEPLGVLRGNANHSEPTEDSSTSFDIERPESSSDDEIEEKLQEVCEVDTRVQRRLTSLHSPSKKKKRRPGTFANTSKPSISSAKLPMPDPPQVMERQSTMPFRARQPDPDPPQTTNIVECLVEDVKAAYQKGRTFRGVIELKFEIGRSLVELLDKDATSKIRDGVMSPKIFDSLLTKLNGQDAIRTHFTTALTSNPWDTHFILNVFEPSTEGPFEHQLFTQPQEAACVINDCRIQFICQDRSDNTVIMEVDAFTPEAYQVFKPAETLGSTFLHHPGHIWDARMHVSATSYDHGVKEEAVKEIVDNLKVRVPLGKVLPQITTRATKPDLAIKSVLLQRQYYFRGLSGLHPDIALEMTEYQQMALMINENKKLMALPFDEPKVWYEISLVPMKDRYTRNTDLKPGEVASWQPEVDQELLASLQYHATNLVRQIDGVGRLNRGPAALLKKKKKEQVWEPDSYW